MEKTVRICTQCSLTKETSEFSGTCAACKSCASEAAKARARANQAQGLCPCGREPRLGKKCCTRCSDRSKAWYENNKEVAKGHTKKHRAANREKINTRNRERWANNVNGAWEKNTVWRELTAERRKAQDRARYAVVKAQVFAHYGEVCACCGVDEMSFLTIDHMRGNGNAHRRQINKFTIYSWLIKQGFPKEFQTLCINCNIGRYKCGGICPHEQERQKAKLEQQLAVIQ